jgi:hypothetical protein
VAGEFSEGGRVCGFRFFGLARVPQLEGQFC